LQNRPIILNFLVFSVAHCTTFRGFGYAENSNCHTII